LKEGKEPSLDDLLRQQTEIELRLPALLPDEYIPDINTRLSLYKRIASAGNENALNELKVELIDRFGLLPDATTNLLTVNKLKLKAAGLGVRRIEAGEKGGYVEFAQNASINPGFLVNLLQSQPQHYRMDGPTKLKVMAPMSDRKDRIKYVDGLLTKLAENTL